MCENGTSCNILFFCASLNVSIASARPTIQLHLWWVGMQDPKLQLLLYGEEVSVLAQVTKPVARKKN